MRTGVIGGTLGYQMVERLRNATPLAGWREESTPATAARTGTAARSKRCSGAGSGPRSLDGW